jgi:hypothetical protein
MVGQRRGVGRPRIIPGTGKRPKSGAPRRAWEAARKRLQAGEEAARKPETLPPPKRLRIRLPRKQRASTQPLPLATTPKHNEGVKKKTRQEKQRTTPPPEEEQFQVESVVGRTEIDGKVPSNVCATVAISSLHHWALAYALLRCFCTSSGKDTRRCKTHGTQKFPTIRNHALAFHREPWEKVKHLKELIHSFEAREAAKSKKKTKVRSHAHCFFVCPGKNSTNQSLYDHSLTTQNRPSSTFQSVALTVLRAQR